ncbi:uncharacterized protein LOC110271507 [Arachis ipaensis]|uniref:uncharacterized protein LOC110271507 n=1 Tax=Arachis ipaensis TaxID=130454 RepID=UPI000A2B6737|nr:uncharacterized protein LOC110271507 [Arachis ipaensis]
MNAVAEAVREAAVAAARAVDHLGVKPPKFTGTLVATDADNWFRAIERSLRAQHVPEGQHGIQRLLQQDEGDIPWNIFKDEFYKKYFPRAARDAKEMELMQLKQGNTTVAEYARKFDDLCRFSKICQGNPADFEEWKCLKFEGGLREDLMSSVVPLEIRNFAELVNKCKLVEECAKKVSAFKASRQGFPPRNYNNYNWQPRRTDFKTPGVPHRRNPQVGNIPARPMGGNGGRPRQDNDVEELDILLRNAQRYSLGIQYEPSKKVECLP